MARAMRAAAQHMGDTHALTLAATTAYGQLLSEGAGSSGEACDVLCRA
jgi:hypothetical protein